MDINFLKGEQESMAREQYMGKVLIAVALMGSAILMMAFEVQAKDLGPPSTVPSPLPIEIIHSSQLDARYGTSSLHQCLDTHLETCREHHELESPMSGTCIIYHFFRCLHTHSSFPLKEADARIYGRAESCIKECLIPKWQPSNLGHEATCLVKCYETKIKN